MAEAGYDEFPRQWWTASTDLKKEVKKAIIPLSSDECSALFYGLEHFLQEGTIVWANYVCVQIGEIERTIGLVGTLSKQAYECFRG